MKLLLGILIFSWSLSFGYTQGRSISGMQLYEEAYQKIVDILEDKKSYSFRDAVFITENAYFKDSLNAQEFNEKIILLSDLVKDHAEFNRNNFQYEFKDKETVLIWASIFKIISDTIPISYKGLTTHHMPYSYDFNDFMGKKDWSKMFVSKLLSTHKGNCHSLPYLYKIIAEEVGVPAHLAIAPNHIYLKHKSMKTGMYNTELTSATFPIDAWLMASGYIHLDAIRSGIYMDTLSKKQSIALCLFDLAKGFERKYGYTNDLFISKCLDKVLEYYPNCINALLFKSEVLKRKMNNSSEVLAKSLFIDYEKLIIKIHRLGYRKMPEQMYLDWLLDLKEHEEKYLNKKVINNFNVTNSN